ncbi:hypothetical protein [Stenotrophomonas humi]
MIGKNLVISGLIEAIMLRSSYIYLMASNAFFWFLVLVNFLLGAYVQACDALVCKVATAFVDYFGLISFLIILVITVILCVRVILVVLGKGKGKGVGVEVSLVVVNWFLFLCCIPFMSG